MSDAKKSERVLIIDVYEGGVLIKKHNSNHNQTKVGFPRLYLAQEQNIHRVGSRSQQFEKKPVQALNEKLAQLSRQGNLPTTSCILGVRHDGLHPFEAGFPITLAVLKLFNQYQPGRVLLQTRSSLVVLLLPLLKQLGDRVEVTIALESPNEEVLRVLTPGAPRARERLQAARTLRRFGVPVHLQVDPILPYGDWQGDAMSFAKLLVANADRLTIGAINNGSVQCERQVRKLPLAQKLAANRKFHWLRPDAAQPLREAVSTMAANKLAPLSLPDFSDRQLSLFAA